jgi:N-acetylglucosamine-6-sulfatase
LDELHLSDNTLIIFTSDNGYYLGEHMLGDKRSGYDEALRIPLLVRYPKGQPANQRIDGMVLNIDLAPTILSTAGVAVPEQMQGHNWTPLVNGTELHPRAAFLYEYFAEGKSPTPTVIGVRTTDRKMLTYPGNDAWTEVFGLANDPYEVSNLVTANHDDLRQALDEQKKFTQFIIPAYADVSDEATDKPKKPKK